MNVRQSTRLSRSPTRCSPNFYSILLTDASEAKCYDEAVQVDTKIHWESTMIDEIESLLKNQTWDLYKLPACRRALQNKLVFKLKEEDGGVKRFKVKLVVKGFAYKKSIHLMKYFLLLLK